LANVQKLAAGEENAGGNDNHVDLDDPQLTAAAGDNTYVQITADGKVLNASPGLKGILPSYAGPPAQIEFGGERALVAGSSLGQGASLQVIRKTGRRLPAGPLT